MNPVLMSVMQMVIVFSKAAWRLQLPGEHKDERI
jgi:hypothetical protein